MSSSSSSKSKQPPIEDALLAGLARLPTPSRSPIATRPSASQPNLPTVSSKRSVQPPQQQRLTTTKPRQKSDLTSPAPAVSPIEDSSHSNQSRPPVPSSNKKNVSSSLPSSTPTSAPARSKQGRLKSSSSPMSSSMSFPPSPSSSNRSISRIDPIDPISRFQLEEMIEKATGRFTKSGNIDMTAIDILLHWMRSGNVDITSVFRSFVISSDMKSLSSHLFNFHVLSVLHILCLKGGPTILSGALHITNPHRPPSILRIIYDILNLYSSSNINDKNSNNKNSDPQDIIYDDSIIFNLIRPSSDSKSKKDDLIRKIIFSYALMLGRKFIFHQRFNDIEINYSLDRFYRCIRMENSVEAMVCDGDLDPNDKLLERRRINDERNTLILSYASFIDIAVLTMISTSIIYSLDEYNNLNKSTNSDNNIFDVQLIAIIFSDACNSLAFAYYLSMKIKKFTQIDDDVEQDDYDLSKQRHFLRKKIKKHFFSKSKSDNSANPMKTTFDNYVDENVKRWVSSEDNNSGRPVRPESRHRREIVCHFSSFRALHKAVEPVLQPSRSQAHR